MPRPDSETPPEEGAQENTMPRNQEPPAAAADTPQETASSQSMNPPISLREYCIGKPVEVLHALAAYLGTHPSRTMKTAQEWAALENEVMNAPATYSPIG